MAVVAAVCFVWFGLVVGISFVEAPLKFRAPGVTTAIGLGIGRVVFRALNAIELVLGLVLLAAAFAATRLVGGIVAIDVVLLVQLIAIRPGLNRRSDRVLAGEDLPRSRLHFAYIALEIPKIIGLLAVGVLALAG
ncbi:hypothetical protein [Fodinicola acaciae]|uniref:hypothetical protein n=1 Tax=Fodinicola acaciae TaxID=2681555 RepID=UPI0013D61B51|nr:hypothetical protein [Fodinicola acaciae]